MHHNGRTPADLDLYRQYHDVPAEFELSSSGRLALILRYGTTSTPIMAATALGSRGSQRNTLYCSNLPDKMQKDDLKKELYMLFSTYGSVLDIVALKTSKMRGQAHVCYTDAQASDRAMQALQGFDFFGKEMVRFQAMLWPHALTLKTRR